MVVVMAVVMLSFVMVMVMAEVMVAFVMVMVMAEAMTATVMAVLGKVEITSDELYQDVRKCELVIKLSL